MLPKWIMWCWKRSIPLRRKGFGVPIQPLIKWDFRGRFDGAPSLDAIVWADFCLEIRGRRVKHYKPGVIMPHEPCIMFVLFCCRRFFSAVIFTRDNEWTRCLWPGTGGKAILLLCHPYRNRCDTLSWGWNHVNYCDHPFQHSSCSAAWIYVTVISIIVIGNWVFSGEISYRKMDFELSGNVVMFQAKMDNICQHCNLSMTSPCVCSVLCLISTWSSANIAVSCRLFSEFYCLHFEKTVVPSWLLFNLSGTWCYQWTLRYRWPETAA